MCCSQNGEGEREKEREIERARGPHTFLAAVAKVIMHALYRLIGVQSLSLR